MPAWPRSPEPQSLNSADPVYWQLGNPNQVVSPLWVLVSISGKWG